MKRLLGGVFSVVLLVSLVGLTSFASTEDEVGIQSTGYGGLGWAFPTTDTRVTSEYGERWGDFHKGFDIGVNEKAVYAVQNGTIMSTARYSDGTEQVTLQVTDRDPYNRNFLTVRYLHLKTGSILVSRNDSVRRSERLATSGNTGTGSTGAHLHFDVNNALKLNGGDMNSSNTINPKYFWPHIYGLLEPLPESIGDKELHSHHDHDHSYLKYDNPEHSFDYVLIESVGVEKFDNWFYSLKEEDRTMTNFKKEFNISNNDIVNIFRTYDLASEKNDN